MKMSIYVIAVVLLNLACSKSGQDERRPDPVLPPSTEITLKDVLPFPYGAAVNLSLIKNNAFYRELVIKEFNSITSENAMKFNALHPAQTTYNWTDADFLVNFAIQNGKRVHGHTLIWYKSLPAWITNFSGDSAAFEQLFKSHIQTVVGHFKGKVASWDVINEPFNDDGTLRNVNTSDPSRGSIWHQKLGPDYIARAFQYAHEADPDAVLFLNEYGHEYGATRRNAVVNLALSLKNRGIPIHGLGLQMHTRYNQTDANLANAITSAASTGLKVHIAELDIALNPDDIQNLTYTSILGQQQAAKYKFIVKTFNAIPRIQQFGITQWNVTDKDSWIPEFNSRPDWPLPFDSNYKRKEAYQGILDGLK